MFYRKIALLLITLGIPGCVGFDNCCLCKFGDWPEAFCFPHADKADKWIEVGKQCADLVDDLYDFDEYTGECNSGRAPYKQKCCTSQAQFPVTDVPQPQPTLAPNEVRPQGIHPLCDICFNKQYPGKPYTITSVTYVSGNPTCRDLFFMGLNKEIDGAMCYPLQLFMQGPCGCDLPPGPGGPPTTPSQAGPTPAPSIAQTSAPVVPVIPMMMVRPPDLNKDSLKLSAGRVRGSTNSYRERGLKGQSSDENPIHPLLQPIESTIESIP